MAEIVTLPRPNLEGSVALEGAINDRRSERDFLPEPLTTEQISQLLWAAQGRAGRGRYRTVPSAGATYPLEVFAVSEQGVFLYLSDKHALKELINHDHRSALAAAAWGQGFIETAPLTLVFAAEFTRTTGRYGQRGIRYVYMEAGHAAQNVHLEAVALGLGSVAVGAFDDAAVSKVLALPEHLEPIYMVTAGYCRRNPV